jgi:hypothetical protein
VGGTSHDHGRLATTLDLLATETMYAVFNPEIGMWAALIPQAGNQSRAYFVYPKTTGYRLQGESMLNLFVSESAKAYVPSRTTAPTPKQSDRSRALTSATLGSHTVSRWRGRARRCSLHNRPDLRSGASFALRGARVLRDQLTNNSDWDAAGHRYAEHHRQNFHSCPKWRNGCALSFWTPRRRQPQCARRRCRRLPRIPRAFPIIF